MTNGSENRSWTREIVVGIVTGLISTLIVAYFVSKVEKRVVYPGIGLEGRDPISAKIFKHTPKTELNPPRYVSPEHHYRIDIEMRYPDGKTQDLPRVLTIDSKSVYSLRKGAKLYLRDDNTGKEVPVPFSIVD